MNALDNLNLEQESVLTVEVSSLDPACLVAWACLLSSDRWIAWSLVQDLSASWADLLRWCSGLQGQG